MSASSRYRVFASQMLLRYRWWVAMLAGLIFISYEVVEHQFFHLTVSTDFYAEVLIFGVVIPLTGGTILTFLARTEAERLRAVRHVDLQRQLSRQLTNARNWDDLVQSLVQFPSTILPITGVSLLVYDQERDAFEPVADWQTVESRRHLTPLAGLALDACRACWAERLGALCSLATCRCYATDDTSEQFNRYCLPLVHGHEPVALLHLFLLPDESLNHDHVELLNSVALAMALAIEGARPQATATIRAQATEAERRRIARELHDTLGQKLGYMRLKLDQMTGEDALQEIAAIQADLAHMRDIANEAYCQMRGTLASLHPSNSIDLAAELLAQARSAAAENGFEVELTSEGQVRSLPPLTQHHVLYLFREALNNVARHAVARRVDIRLVWEAEALTIRLADDGCGFDPDAIRTNGHLGLTIMRARAEEVQGSLTFTSHPDQGSAVTLRLPLNEV